MRQGLGGLGSSHKADGWGALPKAWALHLGRATAMRLEQAVHWAWDVASAT